MKVPLWGGPKHGDVVEVDDDTSRLRYSPEPELPGSHTYRLVKSPIVFTDGTVYVGISQDISDAEVQQMDIPEWERIMWQLWRAKDE